LNLSSDILVSSLCSFKINLYRCAPGELELLRGRLGKLRVRRSVAVAAATKEEQPAGDSVPRLIAAAEAWRGVSAGLVHVVEFSWPCA
jgi:hypothetical protein